MKPFLRCVVRGVLGVILLAVVGAGLLLVSLVAMYCDRHAANAVSG
jgi:hypothetical protein